MMFFKRILLQLPTHQRMLAMAMTLALALVYHHQWKKTLRSTLYYKT